MNLLYLDESGDPRGWSDQRNFVLGGISVHESQIYTLSKEFDDLQEEFFPGIQLPIEIHATVIRNGSNKCFVE